MKSLLWVHMLLLLEWDFMIKLLEKELRVLYQYVTILLFIFLIICLILATIFVPIFLAFYTHIGAATWASMNKSLVLCKSSKLIVIIVAIKESLEGISSKICHVFFEFIIFQIFPFFTNILLIKVIFHRRNEWSAYPLIIQILPREVSEPRMILDFSRTIYT